MLLTHEAKRCADCAFLAEDGEGELLCEVYGRGVQEIRDTDCEMYPWDEVYAQ